MFNVLGAGDGFMAGLLRGWLRGETWRVSATFANACGALVVSRHGCAPAMPSWFEMESLLARAGQLRRLDTDPEIIRLHRTTTGRTPRPLVTALAFDHRRQFEDLAARHDKDASAIEAFKGLIAEAALSVGDVAGAGAIVDDRFGRTALHRLGDGRRWIARPVDLPGSCPLVFEAGDNLAALLRTWPAGHVAKVLVSYRADDAADLRHAQEAKLLSLQALCQTFGHEWLLEVIPAGTSANGQDRLVADAVRRLYEAGLEPDWWKLPPMGTETAWRNVADIVRDNDRHCRGIVILGLDSNEDDLATAFAAARAEGLVKGFAVGRHIFWATAEAWFAGRIDDRRAVSEIAARYRRVIGLWDAAGAAYPALAASDTR